MPQEENTVNRKADKLMKNGGSTPLATLEATMEVADKLSEVAELLASMPRTLSMEGVERVDIKGDKGDKGEMPSVEDLLSLIKPLIPEPIKGDKGDKSTTPGPRGPRGEVGPRGRDGIDGREIMFHGSKPPTNPQIGDLWYKN